MKKLYIFLICFFIIISILSYKNNRNSEEKKLTIYASLMEEQAITAVEEFEKETGIKTNFIRMSSGEILEKIRKEKNNMKASVWYGGTADTFIDAYEEGLIEPYKSPNSYMIPDKYKDENGIWTGIYIGYLGFVANERWLKENNIDMPNSWNDLLKPEFEGNIVLPNPRTSGTAYTIVATIIQLMGEEKGIDFLKKLDKQVVQYTKSGFTPGIVVGLGEAGVGVAFLNNVIRYEKEGYRNIKMAAPKDGTGYEIGAVAILKDAPDMNEAKKFVDWSLTKRAQELGKDVGAYQVLTNYEAVSPKDIEFIKGINLIEYDFEWSGKNRKRLIKKLED